MIQKVVDTIRHEDKPAPSPRRQARPRPAGKPAKKPEAKRQTKKQPLIRLLSGKTGADVATISDRLGWQQHTTRAALTHLRKTGYTIAAEKPDAKAARHRIAAAPGKD